MANVLQKVSSSSTSASSSLGLSTIERRGPSIRIIRSRRNPIDVMLSSYGQPRTHNFFVPCGHICL
jgi:hypothetical protein